MAFAEVAAALVCKIFIMTATILEVQYFLPEYQFQHPFTAEKQLPVVGDDTLNPILASKSSHAVGQDSGWEGR